MKIRSKMIVSTILGILGMLTFGAKANAECVIYDCLKSAHSAVASAVLSCCGEEGSTSRQIASYMCLKGVSDVASGFIKLCQSASSAPPGGVCIPHSSGEKGATHLICCQSPKSCVSGVCQ